MLLDREDVSLCINDYTEPGSTGGAPVTTPIVRTSLFSFPTLEELQSGLSRESRTHVYSRGQNPTVEVLEKKLAVLERSEACKCFASGMAAISAVIFGLLKSGDHILFVNNTYGPSLQLAERMKDFGVEHDMVPDTDPELIEASIKPNTKLMWLESPGTMTFRVLDLEIVTKMARDRGIVTCIDNSWATPLLLKPIELGVDLVVHTGTKYLNGHSDLLAGALIGSDELIGRLFHRSYMLLGGIMSPDDAWLVLRGMRTLPVRLRQHETDALFIAKALENNPAVRAVSHPKLTTESALYDRQFKGASGVFAIELADDDVANVRKVVNSLRLFHRGVSWGGVESLVIAPSNGRNDARLAAQKIPRGTVRLSIGLEGAEPLLEDLERALSSAL